MTTDMTKEQLEARDGNPERIWLSPICDDHAHHGDGRTWAAPAPEDECDCYIRRHPWVEYIRSDVAGDL